MPQYRYVKMKHYNIIVNFLKRILGGINMTFFVKRFDFECLEQ